MLPDSLVNRLIALLLLAWRRIANEDSKQAEGLGILEAIAELELLDAQGLNDPYAQDYALQYEYAGIASITARLAATTRATLIQALRDGLGTDDAARLLGERLDGFYGRIDTLARTEMNRAANWGRYTAWRQSGVVQRKEFIATLDDRVRPSHLAAHGEVVGIDEPFTVGAASGTFMPPCEADPYNCRCTAAPVTIFTTPRDLAKDAEQGQQQADALGYRVKHRKAAITQIKGVRSLEDHHAARLNEALTVYVKALQASVKIPGVLVTH